jgi:hypothetical protein
MEKLDWVAGCRTNEKLRIMVGLERRDEAIDVLSRPLEDFPMAFEANVTWFRASRAERPAQCKALPHSGCLQFQESDCLHSQ